MSGHEVALAIGDAQERVGATLDDLRTRAREGRRAVRRAQYAVEDAGATLALRVRRRPLSAVAVSLAVGVLVGGLIGVVGMCVAPRRRAADGDPRS
jgi:ElaB/YqjD/DUF883 family membrane-anchored ribosome-binding protein